MTTPIIGIPTTRVSDMFIRERLLNQVQFDQAELFRVQTQMSTGRRFEAPSEDPVAALRVMSLQRLLERKEQVQNNLTTNQSYLSATDAALSEVSGLIAEIRGIALEVLGTTASDSQRQAAAQQVDQAIKQMLDTGNQKFRGRYLFAGSRTQVTPFEEIEGGIIKYNGNEERLSSYSDIDLLFDTSINGNEVFGAISEAVHGTEDLEPVLTYDTRLADLRGGLGVSLGSLAISDSNDTSIVDVSTAETIGDLAALIRANPPQGRELYVEITHKALVIQLDPAAGDLSIREVAGGTTADELGILTETGVGHNPIVGRDLDPVVKTTTPLADVLGVRARAVVRSAALDNDIIVEADTSGPQLNGVTISFVDDPLVVAGSEVATYDALLGTIEVRIDEGNTRAYRVVEALEALHDLGSLPFTARLDPLDDQDGGKGLIEVTATAQTQYGDEGVLDQTSGLQIVNGGETHTISLATAETVEDLLNLLNGSDAGVLAEINEEKTGIDVRSLLSGSDFMIGENGGTTATQLGLRTFTLDTRLEDLNLGRGVDEFTGSERVASASIESNGINNDLLIEATAAGGEWNDYSVSFVDSGGPVGSETLIYNPVAKTLEFRIVPGSTTANDVVYLFYNTPGARDDFDVGLDSADGQPNDGTGLINLGSVTTEGGRAGGTDFTITRTDGVTLEIDIGGQETIGEVITLINNSNPPGTGVPLVARLSTYGNGIELVDDNAGTGTLTVTRAELSTAAIGLGLIPEGQVSSGPTTLNVAARLDLILAGVDNDLTFQADLPGTYGNVQVIFTDNGLGAGNETVDYDDGAATLSFGIDLATTDANRIIALVEGEPSVAALFTVSLNLVNEPTNNGNGLIGSEFGVDMTGGQAEVLTGSDVHPLETEGVLTALLRLRAALEASDVLEAQRAIDLMDQEVLDLNFSRAELGARQQGLNTTQLRLDTEEIELRDVLSLEYDADLVEVVSNLTAKQATFEASLRATATILQMSLMNYL